jgi:hypothetical protein
MIGPKPGPSSCYTVSGEAGVLVLRSALMSRVQLVVERYTSLEHFEGVLVEQGLITQESVARQLGRQHFALRSALPLDVILPAVEVGSKKGSA